MGSARKEVVKKPWSIEDCIFRSRKYGPNPCESKDFWECYRAEKGEGGIRFDFARLFGTKE